MKRHECRFSAPYRGRRHCRYCWKLQFRMLDGIWKNEMTLAQFADAWLPAISGTNPKKMLVVEVAFPFEWNCYESWNVVFRVRFELPEPPREDLRTRAHVMNGWESPWSESFARIDYEARKHFEEVAGRKYEIGDNAYEEMRRIIQA